ncbi:ABC transporter permease [Colwellia piezophila]|uniref:ABC transporter permease n=1 Tax=Colwellia piezophila TaxID=211668 RepID=UPI00036AE3FE|nr:ABC transporter permease [Colwellia piezophila]
MSFLINEIKTTVASLSRVPGFVLTTVFTLSLTLGVLLTAFSLNHLLIFKALPYPDAQNLILMEQELQEGERKYSGSQYFVAQKLMYLQQKSLASMTMVFRSSAILASLRDKPLTELSYVTPEYFDMLGVPVVLGRGFTEKESIDSNTASALISEQLWREQYAADADIVGQSITLGEQQYKIVGVVASSFAEPANFADDANSQIWLPWDFHGQDEETWNYVYSQTAAIGKLLPATTISQVSDEFNALVDPIFQQNGRVGHAKHQVIIAQFQDLQVAIVGDNKYIALLILLGAGALLLIACANIVNLFFSRAAQRQRALVIQATLGAKLKHLFFTIWLESLLLCVASMVIGLIIAGWSIELLRSVASHALPRLNELSLDLTAIAFACTLTLILSLIFAVITLKLINHKQLISQLQSSGKGTGAQVNSKVRNTLVASQICLATLLLIVTSLVMTNALQVLNHPLGFEDENLYNLRLDIGEGYPEKEGKRQLSRDLLAQLQKMNGVENISRASNAPIRRGSNNTGLFNNDNVKLGHFSYVSIDDNYFNTIGLKILAGRSYNQQDIRDDSETIILSKAAATKLVAATGDGNGKIEDTIGKAVYSAGGDSWTVIGVVDNVYNPYNHDRTQGAMMYFGSSRTNFIIRMQEGNTLAKTQIINLLDEHFSDIKVWQFAAISDIHEQLVYQKKLTLWLSLVLGLFALLLAAVGIYGVISYNSQMRRYELGIRMSLGAKSKRILLEFIAESLTPISAGFGLSLLLAVILYSFAQQHINQWLSFDWLMISSSLLALIVIALAACYFPAKKIIASDPIKALRNE